MFCSNFIFQHPNFYANVPWYQLFSTLILSRFDIELWSTLIQMEVVNPIPSCLPSLTQNSQITHDVSLTRNQDIFCDYESHKSKDHVQQQQFECNFRIFAPFRTNSKYPYLNLCESWCTLNIKIDSLIISNVTSQSNFILLESWRRRVTKVVLRSTWKKSSSLIFAFLEW